MEDAKERPDRGIDLDKDIRTLASTMKICDPCGIGLLACSSHQEVGCYTIVLQPLKSVNSHRMHLARIGGRLLTHCLPTKPRPRNFVHR